MPRCRPAPATPPITSSTSLISFRLEEVAKSLTTGRGKSYWFMLEPLIMSKQIFDALPKKRAGRRSWRSAQEMEEFGTKEAMADDQKVAEVYSQEGRCRSPISTTRPSRSGARSRATPPGRTMRPRRALSAELLKLAEGVQVS